MSNRTLLSFSGYSDDEGKGPCSPAGILCMILGLVLALGFQQRARAQVDTSSSAEDVGTKRQLFVDDVLVSRKEHVDRVTHQAERLAEPVLKADRPWEGRRVYMYGNVIYDSTEALYKMWYLARPGPGYTDALPGLESPGDIICYAVSADGVHWTKPNLGIYSWNGSSKNNIVMINHHEPSVRYEPDAPKQERYKMIAWKNAGEKKGTEDRYYAYRSGDGVHWEPVSEEPLWDPKIPSGEIISLTRDPDTGTYYAYPRMSDDQFDSGRRAIGISSSSDFVHWSKPELLLSPDAKDDKWAEGPEQRTEFYSMSGFWYESQFLGTLSVFRLTPTTETRQPGANQSPVDGPIDMQLVHSRDGKVWKRAEDRTPILPRGKEGTFDGGMIMSTEDNPEIQDNQLWMYYTGFNTTHGAPMPPKRASIGLAIWRLDGFVSLSAGSREGMVETVPVRPGGDELYVNANAVEGRLLVEVLSEDGEVMPGYSKELCEPITTDGVRQAVRWKGRDEIETDEPVRLRFYLTNGDLYSYRFADN